MAVRHVLVRESVFWRKLITARTLITAGLFLISCALIADRQAKAAGPQPNELVVMSYNLRYASPTGKNSWPDRRPAAREVINLVAPHLIGTQEGLYNQLKDMEADLPEYRWIGLGREGGSRGEFMAVFYRRERLEPLEYDHFWLSDTPETIGTATWGNSVKRMVTWVKFRDLGTSQEFYFVNTHLDHQSQPSREKSAELILERLAKLPAQTPLILVGDFNAAAKKNKVYEILVDQGGLTDTWVKSPEHGEEVGTFHNYAGPEKGGARIDWILTRGPIKPLFAEVLTFAKDGQYPSDHFPIMARLRLEK